MLIRTLAAIFLIAITWAFIEKAPLPVFLLAATGFIVAGLWELRRLLAPYGFAVYLPTALVTILLPWISSYAEIALLEFLAAASFLILIWSVPALEDVSTGLGSAGANVLIPLYLGLPFCFLAQYRESERLELWLILAVIWIADIAAYIVGRFVGKHRVTPRISPGKTLEGYLAALGAGAATALVFGNLYLPGRSPAFLLTAGLVLGASGIVGDLFESVIKRGAAIKDSSHLIPGHGGVLDRIDSLLFALPAYHWFAWLVRSWAV